MGPAADNPGYRKAGFIGDDVVAALRLVFDDLGPGPDHGFYTTTGDADRTVSLKATNAIESLLSSPLQRIAPGHELLLTGFVSKGRSGPVTVNYHQDLTYLDERTHRATLWWIPLVDVGPDSGCLRVVPNSHRWTTGIRPAMANLPTEPHQVQLGRLAQPIPMNSGEVLAYDAGLIHGSGPDGHDRVRTAVAVALIPEGATPVHSVEVDSEVESYEVDRRFYTAQTLWERPVGYQRISSPSKPVVPSDFARWLSIPTGTTA